MMRTAAFGIAATVSCLITAGANCDEPKYVGVVNVIATTGKYERTYIAGTQAGVSLSECELRRDVWLKEVGSLMESATADLRREGKSSGFSTACERLDNQPTKAE